MLSIENCPYRCKMYWYCYLPYPLIAYVYDTKAEAVKQAKQLHAYGARDVNVSWIENSMNRKLTWLDLRDAIDKNLKTIHDLRKAPNHAN